jgi:endogenous inhibitor of DNA gyrase (YacG/DUF329 family)
MTAPRLCPVCRRPIQDGAEVDRFRPFCSKRCADVDLGRWLQGSYAIPAVETDDESESEAGGSEPEGTAAAVPQRSRGGKPVRH